MAEMNAITVQPGGRAPYGPPGGVAPESGLECLERIDRVFVQQKIEKLQILTGFETRNCYVVKNAMGQQILKVKEKSGIRCRCCCGADRPLTLNVYDNNKQIIMVMKKPWKCCAGCCAMCLCCCSCLGVSMAIEAPPGNPIGYVQQGQGFCVLKLNVQDAAGDTQMYMRGRINCCKRCKCCCCCCCRDVVFPIYKDGDQIGKVTKKWSGVGKEVFTESDNYELTFPYDLDVNMKAGLIASNLLMDYMMFEQQ